MTVMTRERRGVRWNEELQIYEMRCDDCAARRQSNYYWPLEEEFWNHRQLQRCRACDSARNRDRVRSTREHKLIMRHRRDQQSERLQRTIATVVIRKYT